VIVVDDGSRDGSAQVLQALKAEFPELRVVTHLKNLGYGTAVRSGLDAATSEWIGFMDSDQQFMAEDFDKLSALSASAPFITGRRRHRADPLQRKINAKIFGILVWLILGVWIRDVNCAMKLMKRTIWQQVRPRVATGGLFNAEVFYRLKRAGIVWKQVDVRHFPRKAGAQTGASPRVILTAIKEMFVLRFQS
jgi:glycosyltransferase involved in cell wall biosynthesis